MKTWRSTALDRVPHPVDIVVQGALAQIDPLPQPLDGGIVGSPWQMSRAWQPRPAVRSTSIRNWGIWS